jgi:hypothetical protein
LKTNREAVPVTAKIILSSVGALEEAESAYTLFHGAFLFIKILVFGRSRPVEQPVCKRARCKGGRSSPCLWCIGFIDISK